MTAIFVPIPAFNGNPVIYASAFVQSQHKRIESRIAVLFLYLTSVNFYWPCHAIWCAIDFNVRICVGDKLMYHAH